MPWQIVNFARIEGMSAPSGHQHVEQFRNGEDLINLYRFPNGYGAEITVALVAGGAAMDSRSVRCRTNSTASPLSRPGR